MCIITLYVCNDVCTYYVCHRLVCSFDYVRCIVPIICSRTPCLQTRLVKRRSRKCTDATRGQSQFEFSCRQASRWPADLCWYTRGDRGPPIKHQSTHPGLGLVPGKRLRIAHMRLSYTSYTSGPAQGGGRASVGPPHAHREFVCLWSVCGHYQMDLTVAIQIWACSLRLVP